jgi:tight adherence protein C
VLASVAATLAVAAALGARRDPLVAISAHGRTAARRATTLERFGSLPIFRRVAGVERIERLLAASDWERSAAEMVGMKWLVGALFVVAGSALFGSVPLALVLGVAAFRAPDIALARGAGRRRRRADRELPLFLDLLAAAATAGSTGLLAVKHATEATEGPLAEELSAALRRVDLGGRWSTELAAAAERLDLPDLRRASAVLARSGSIGSSLSDALTQLARESRETRRAFVAERARKAPVKMLFPLVFLVLPAFLLLTVVPVLVTTLRSIR